MIEAIKKEISLRSKNYNDEIETIYFGGGTPSLLKIKDINDIFPVSYTHLRSPRDRTRSRMPSSA